MQEELQTMLKDCHLCPRNCGVDRLAGQKGFCGVDAGIMVARAALHMWEEPCISGKEGSGAMSLSYHRQADLAFAQKQVEEFSSACFLFLPNTNRQIFICLKKLYSLIQIYATLYKKP